MKAQLAQMERLRSLNSQALAAIEESNRRTKEYNERKSQEADEEKAAQEQVEKGLHDFATERIIALQRAEAERQKAEAETRARDWEKEQKAEAHFQDVSERFDKVNGLQNSRPREYIGELSSLADAYQEKGEKEKAQQLRLQAINAFLKVDAKELDSNFISLAFRILGNAMRRGAVTLSADEVVSYFRKLAECAEVDQRQHERMNANLTNSIYRFVDDAYDRIQRDPAGMVRLYQAWVDVKKKVKGEQDPSIEPLLTRINRLKR